MSCCVNVAPGTAAVPPISKSPEVGGVLISNVISVWSVSGSMADSKVNGIVLVSLPGSVSPVFITTEGPIGVPGDLYS